MNSYISKKDQEFAYAMSTKLRLNRENYTALLAQKKKLINLTVEQKELIGEFRLSIIRDGLKNFLIYIH